MTRLDQLAQPTRRNGEHIRAVIERQRQHQIESNLELERSASSASGKRKISRSLTHLSSGSTARSPAPLKLHQIGRSASASKHTNLMSQSMTSGRPLRKSNATKSMTQLVTAKLLSSPKLTPTVVQARKALSLNRSPPRSQQSQSHANDIEIDSRTTNVSVTGVCSPFPFCPMCTKNNKTTKIDFLLFILF